MQTLQSYIAGQWQTGQGEGTALENAATGETVARCSTEGLDLGAAVRHAREVGGLALRKMTFAERAEMLKGLSGAIHEIREELISMGARNGGNTRGDAKFDIDGATGTLAAYAALGKDLGDRKFMTDGDGLQLGRTGRFWGQHIRTPRQGVAVHINAFNFPAWGMFEKMACALLAGVPVIEKPGSATALIAWRCAQVAVESGLVPEGGFQFVCGSAGDLLSHLNGQDCVAFTGSAATGAKIRGHETLVAENVRVNIEADSINAAVLAPDVDTDAETYGLFISNVAQDMCQKAGQKCTAVRRIFVPKDRVKEVMTDLSADLDRYPMGPPDEKNTRLGPVAHSGQASDVEAGIARLSEVAEANVQDAEAPDGACYVRPTIFVAKDANAALLHELEVFGPVATIIPYDGSVDHAIEAVNRGGGGLVVSGYSNDSSWAEEFVLGVAPYHGRIWMGSDRMASQALPPGMVLPQLVHGGPGRAGGGEELGGLRGLEFYTQRTAIQGFKSFVDGTFGASGS